MKKRWPALILAMIFTLFAASGALAAPARAGSQAAINSAQRVAADQEFETFLQDMFADYSVEITAEQKAELKSLFDRITALEADENYLEAYEEWKRFYSLTDPIWENAVYNYPDFDEFIDGMLPEDISDADRSELRRLYDQAVEQENNGEWDAAGISWSKFETLLDSCWSASEINLPDEDYWEEDYGDEDSWDENIEYPSFEDYYGEEYLDELGLEADERAEMKALYDEAVALEHSGEWEDAEAKWQALWNIEAAHYDSGLASAEYLSFDEFIADYDGNFSPRALEQMRTVYDEAVQLEKSGDWEGAADKWDALYYIMDQCGAFAEYDSCDDSSVINA